MLVTAYTEIPVQEVPLDDPVLTQVITTARRWLPPSLLACPKFVHTMAWACYVHKNNRSVPSGFSIQETLHLALEKAVRTHQVNAQFLADFDRNNPSLR